MAIPEWMSMENVKDTKAYRDYLAGRTGIDVPIVQLQPSGPTLKRIGKTLAPVGRNV